MGRTWCSVRRPGLESRATSALFASCSEIATVPGRAAPSSSHEPTCFSSVLAPDALGGERDIFLSRTSANQGAVMVDVGMTVTGALAYASGVNTKGSALIVYDGIDG